MQFVVERDLALLLIFTQIAFVFLFIKSERLRDLADVVSCGLSGAFIHLLLLQLGQIKSNEWEIISASMLVLSFSFIGWSLTRLDAQKIGLNSDSELHKRYPISSFDTDFHNERLKTLGIFSATFIHEINQPLSILLLKVQDTQKALEENDTKRMEKGLSGIEKQLQNIVQLTQSLKTFSASQRNLDSGFVSVKEIFEFVDDLCGIWLNSRNVRLIWPQNYPSIEVSGGRTLHAQVLLNLIKNAVDAMNGFSEDVEKWVKLDINERSGTVEFTVSNAGPAIDKTARHFLFKAFFSTKKAGTGTGLGLAVSRELVESVGGEIHYDDLSPFPKFVVRYSFLPSVRDEMSDKSVDENYHSLRDVA